MALNLDPRQRAMLQEMGITVWQPAPPEPAQAATAVALEQRPAPMAQRAPQPPASPAPRPAPAAATQAPARPQPAPAPQRPPASESAAATGWRLHPARPVYGPSSNAPAAADGGWLILLEHPTALGLPAAAPEPRPTGTVLEGDAARLLDNMLRALRLHQHPRVWSAALERDTAQASAAAGDCPPLDSGLQTMVQTLRPARILVLGLAAARAVLGRSDALGRLRAEPHQAAGVPAVVTYDPNYLLRAAHAKPAAWADLCRAQSLGQTITAR
ncbi:uracil-DNA glycosylase family protein [Pantoea sp. 18069]|uniref:uracil-DNA glycosylase family protein n=1 Tax=Pantoea sp. 18069 TaxID=2681415 RepID=UPI00135C28EB|nr:uracil-DNA glycosylase family protein [Pantoea sp. 18069]